MNVCEENGASEFWYGLTLTAVIILIAIMVVDLVGRSACQQYKEILTDHIVGYTTWSGCKVSINGDSVSLDEYLKGES